MANNAKDFYGKAYNETNAEKLDNAFKYLTLALKAESEGNETKLNMAFKAAVKNEGEAFA